METEHLLDPEFIYIITCDPLEYPHRDFDWLDSVGTTDPLRPIGLYTDRGEGQATGTLVQFTGVTQRANRYGPAMYEVEWVDKNFERDTRWVTLGNVAQLYGSIGAVLNG